MCFKNFMADSISQLSKPNSESSEVFPMASNITTMQQSSMAPFSLPISISAQVGIVILTLAFVLGFPGNLFVVWSVFCQVKKRSVTCLLVLNLALADAFVLLSAPLFLRYLAGGRGWEFGTAACKLVHYLSSVNMYVSIYLICLMSMDRWLAVSRPFLSQRMRTKRSLLVLLLVVWVTAFILSLPMPFYRSNLKKTFLSHNVTLNFCIPYHWESMGHQVFQYIFETVMGCLVPFSLINTCYASVICRLRSAMFHRRGQGSRLILMIICAFAIFWLPYHIVNIIEVAGMLQGSKSVTDAARTARPNVTAFAYFSSAVNPILYVFAGSSHIRQAGLSFMGKLFEATNSESRSTSFTRSGRGSSPDESSALHALSVKLGKPFKSKSKDRSYSEAGKEAETLGSVQQLD
ncbi:leukotriene B4 receptor 1 isoform X2 [Seriola aureovittata]|uniref:leukotriene B4 receptor 1 isoform X2 n=1 Tax=Seriola aureovittata TaxID=2871759 RepID=UPI0024BEBC4A|nr:leukotriene B4 receptor 1 isoform X2 [Seriola aureovittata]